MNKLLEQPPGIVETVVRYECPRCGNSCQCGIPYSAKTVRAVEAVRANPEKSDRAIAAEIGVSRMTVTRARATVPDVTVDERTGLDGKTRKMPEREVRKDSAESAEKVRTRDDGLADQAHRLLDKIVGLLRQMDQRQRLLFRTSALQQMADAYLDNDTIEF
jgi:hypothetical protein